MENIVQLPLFLDPRDMALEQALQELGQLEWYQDPLHRFIDGGALWYHLHIQNVTIDGQEIDLNYCRKWMAQGHKGWNGLHLAR